MSTAQSLALAAIPVLAAIVGWFMLWRRNTILCLVRTVHFCGDDLKRNGFWSDKKKAPPLIDAKLIEFQNFGLKHITEFEFVSHNVAEDYVFHPNHGNSMPVTNFSHEYKNGLLHVRVREIPAFEKFSVSLLNTDPRRSFRPVAAAGSYILKPRENYFKRLSIRIFAVIGLAVALVIAILHYA